LRLRVRVRVNLLHAPRHQLEDTILTDGPAPANVLGLLPTHPDLEKLRVLLGVRTVGKAGRLLHLVRVRARAIGLVGLGG
jgi:hypothetical protein